MNVGTILAAKGATVQTVTPSATVSTVVQKLKLHGIGALVVSHDGRAVQGIVSERDVVQGLAAHGPDLLETTVDGIMTRSVETCGRDRSVADVMTLMTARRIRHVPVVEDDALCGMISIGDVVKHRLVETEAEAQALRDYVLAGH